MMRITINEIKSYFFERFEPKSIIKSWKQLSDSLYLINGDFKIRYMDMNGNIVRIGFEKNVGFLVFTHPSKLEEEYGSLTKGFIRYVRD